MTHPLRLVRADSAALWLAARRLVEEYVASLGIDLGFQDIEREISELSTEYGEPGGCFILAEQDDVFVGCGGLRRFSVSACEMKRLYVVPGHRGSSVGRALAEALISHASRIGYETILLDTLPSMDGAHALYTSLGFTSTRPYRHNPVPGTRFMEFRLR